MSIMDWLSSMKGDKNTKGAHTDEHPSVAEPSESSVENYLRSGQASPSFTLMADDVKNQLVDKVMHMPRALQADVLTRMQTMALDELIGFATGEGVPQKPAAQRSYTVSQGDSLSKIAKAHKVSVKSIVAANPQISNPDLIHPKQVINLPPEAGQ